MKIKNIHNERKKKKYWERGRNDTQAVFLKHMKRIDLFISQAHLLKDVSNKSHPVFTSSYSFM